MKKYTKKEMDKIYENYMIDQSSTYQEFLDIIKYIFDDVEFIHIDREPLYGLCDVIFYNKKSHFGKKTLWDQYKLKVGKTEKIDESKSKIKEWFRVSIQRVIKEHKEKYPLCSCGNVAVDVHHDIISFDEIFNNFIKLS